ncbi:MAG: hypothetical protein DRJ59_04415 [Thermoprotei archaeon]|nr:MAG: hypothetical protein DRJ59_04415 [Thermoprotei archaeon]
MSAYTSRIGTTVEGCSFSRIYFVLEPGEKVSPGELVKVEVNRDIYVICRVLEAKVVSEYDKPSRVYTRRILRLEANPSDVAPGRFVLVEAETIEELRREENDWKVTNVSSLVAAGSPVYRLGDLAKLLLGFPPEDRGLHIGELWTGTTSGSCPVTLDPNEVLPRHVLIVGTTGTGKSYALGVLAEELSKLGIRHIHVDVHGEFLTAAKELGGKIMVPGDDLTIRLSSLSELELIELIPGLTELQSEIVRRAFLELKKAGGDFTVDDLVDEIERVAPLFRARNDTVLNAKARAALLNRVRIIGRGVDWKSLLDKPTFIDIDCRYLIHSELQALTAALARELLELLRDESVRKRLRGVVLSIDEAHLFLPPRGREFAPSASVLGEVIRFGRHYGLCLVLITQSPMDIDRRVIRTTNTRLIFAIEPDQLEALRGVFADAPAEVIRNLPKLERGVCLLTGSRETVRHAVLLRIRRRKTTHGGETPKLIENKGDEM